ncbi:MAG: hypothetical protein JWO11_4433 [Nocardioides sp.]|nr:hypothetical protein [Nocardioides sp.]
MAEIWFAKPWQLRFTDPDDIKVYGDGWYVYDEAQIVRLDARRLVALEVQIGRPMAAVIDANRAGSVFGELAAAWLAVHLVDPGLAGEFDQFSPLIMLVDWERSPEPETPKADLDPLDLTPSASSTDGPPTE